MKQINCPTCGHGITVIAESRKVSYYLCQQCGGKVAYTQSRSEPSLAILLAIAIICVLIIGGLAIYHFIILPNSFRQAVIKPLEGGAAYDDIVARIDKFYNQKKSDRSGIDRDISQVMIKNLINALARDARSWDDVKAKRQDAETILRSIAFKYDCQADLVGSLIKRAIPGSEKFILSVLEDGKPVGAANAMINSRNKVLEDDARAWAKAHGYKIEPAPGHGPRGPRWGR